MNRRQLTERLIELLPEERKIPIDEAQQFWWINPRNTGGFRLSKTGFDIMHRELEFEHWTVTSPANLRLLLELDKKLQSPYYVDAKKKELVLFGSREAMMATLHGDVKRYLDLLERRSV